MGVVEVLSGEAEISPGVRLTSRNTVVQRTHVRRYLADALRTLGLEPREHAYRRNGVNVYAELPATVPNAPTVVIGAHFDTVPRSPGASDNATGIAAVLHATASLSARPARAMNVVVVFFDEEELGLLGSTAFARWLRQQGTAVHSVHTIDQLGWDGDDDRAIELELPAPELLALYRDAAQATGYRGALHATRTSTTDHHAFRREGFAAVGLTEEYVHGDTSPHYHRPTNTADTVDVDYLLEASDFFSEVMTRLVSPSPA
jgi:Zn-dependent M28 family amino/carboxypeptidase